ncbi:MAG: transposase [bacterium]
MLRKDPFITGEYYHIYNRGVDKRVIFKSAQDFKRFMISLYLSNSEKSFRIKDIIKNQNKSHQDLFFVDTDKKIVSVGAWCLMSNHFHILVRQEIDGGISRFMKKLGTSYSMYFNMKYERTGALFGGLFKSKLVGNDDNYLRQLLAYIHLNPLEIEFGDWVNNTERDEDKMRRFLDSYKYSSFTDYITDNPISRVERSIISPENFPDYFQSQQSFKDFVENYFLLSRGRSSGRE